MSLTQKIFVYWNVLFLSLATIPRCETIFSLYNEINQFFEEKAEEHPCHNLVVESPKVISKSVALRETQASCRCMTDQFVKVVLPNIVEFTAFSYSQYQELKVNPYQSLFHLQIAFKQEFRPPIFS